MATGRTYTTGDRRRYRWLRNLVVLAIAGLGIALALAWGGLREEAVASTAYAARVGCSCRFISGRDIESCKAAVKIAPLGRTEPLLFLSDDAQARSITARVPLLAAQTARYSRESGCVIEPWQP